MIGGIIVDLDREIFQPFLDVVKELVDLRDWREAIIVVARGTVAVRCTLHAAA